MSLVNQLMTDSVDCALDALQADGVAFYIKAGGEERQIARFSSSRLAFVDDIDSESNELRRRETLTIAVPTSEMQWIDAVAAGDKVRLPNGSEWSVDLSTTTHGPTYMVIGLARKPLMRQWEARRAGV